MCVVVQGSENFGFTLIKAYEHTEGGTSIPLQTTNYFYLACKQVSNNVKTVRRPLLTRWQQQQQRQKRAQWHIIFIPFQQLLFSLVKIRDDVKV